ncbi:MAG: Flp pilus assembly protein CpaB [Hyphomonas sp.]|uniref:Flp pilus assembly protein CpaB n=1 Tax=unclassified Hyphomonas TaxID=2630699 RepID=UPI000B6376F1|nr:Flp pilus assembly protein CpaB [Hyphomonas sp.]MAH92079.1 Flp pilus assembly protein CpaB [Hyphomonas sp.]OUX89143.1 MAG: Flp pilus assembly protein CpaB [Hyphomonas sp. TMED31]
MSPVRLIILIGAAIAAIAAAFLVRNLVDATPSQAVQSTVVETVEVSETKVLVAARDLMIGDVVTVDDLEWADWPEDNVVEGYLTEESSPEAIEEWAGTVVRIPMFELEPILTKKLVAKGDTGTMAALVTPGMRAISVEISTESASGGFILPNDYVDVIMTYQMTFVGPDGAPAEQTTSETILQNVRVLAIDQIHTKDSETEGPYQVGNTATLEVNNKEAELIALAERKGRLTLSLRPWSDVGDTFERDARVDLLETGGSSNGGIKIYRSGKATSAGPGGS